MEEGCEWRKRSERWQQDQAFSGSSATNYESSRVDPFALDADSSSSNNNAFNALSDDSSASNAFENRGDGRNSFQGNSMFNSSNNSNSGNLLASLSSDRDRMQKPAAVPSASLETMRKELEEYRTIYSYPFSSMVSLSVGRRRCRM